MHSTKLSQEEPPRGCSSREWRDSSALLKEVDVPSIGRPSLVFPTLDAMDSGRPKLLQKDLDLRSARIE